MTEIVSNNLLKGYRGLAKDVLTGLGARVWADVEVKTTKGDYVGLILPRSETADDQHMVLKLRTGYNIGVNVNTITEIKEVGYKEAHYKIPEKEFPRDPNKPNITLLGTGGTIASRLDYRTGAVIPAFSPGELYGAVPELADVCNLETIKLFGIFSEDMSPLQWTTLAKGIGEQIKKGVDGIVIGHGTDTMHHTSAILSYMVQKPPVPIILVGSQRSSDRPSSDAALNLINATRSAAYGDIAEVLVCMFGPTSDQYCLLHRGTRVRKMHSSYRSTFRTLSDSPVGRVSPTEYVVLKEHVNRRRKDREVIIDPAFEEKVSIVYYYPNMKPDIIESLVDNGYKGIVIAGTGLGHVNKPLYEPIRVACNKGVHVFMTVQTLWGYVQMFVYETGRELMQRGIVPAANMLPEAAYMKLCWVLGHTLERGKVIEMMLTPIADEITEREPHDGYLVMQGGLPEVQKMLQHLAK
ncbi:MAG: Glu-tRNA(Gln) amidotransferase subunit GatD [Candidatus Coatesbacteria bacterium]|nr:Glu-tRNA(Gln) amidotransferase subunit GatD [Candidatus Coatesbacteria bacterium]